jgi:hypothetical protein
MIVANMSWSGVDSMLRYLSSVRLLNRPLYSDSLSAFDDCFENLLLAYMDSRLSRVDRYGSRVSMDILWNG